MAIRSLVKIPSLKNKSVLLRLDTDIDLENGKIIDDTRLQAGLETLNFLLKRGADVIIVGHLGRPGRNAQKSEFSLESVAKWLAKKYKGHLEKLKIGYFDAWEVNSHITLLENIRFFEGEEENDKGFAKDLSLLGDVFVNDAFAVSHREHASIVGVCKFLPSYPGFHLTKEIKTLEKIMESPKRPLAVLIGGAKIETKLPLVEKMHQIADYVLVGGEIAEQDRVLIHIQHEKISGKKSMVLVGELNEGKTDMTQKSIENFKQVFELSNTIVWNGPVGVIRKKKDRKKGNDTEKGTRDLAKAIIASGAYSVIGGGDTLAYLKEIKLLSKFDFVSTGGGAMLEFLSGKNLPGIEALK